MTDKHRHFLKSESHLLLAINLCESNERDVIHTLSLKLVKLPMYYFLSRDTDVSSNTSNDNVELNTEHRSTGDRQNSLNGRNAQKCLLYCSSTEKLDQTI